MMNYQHENILHYATKIHFFFWVSFEMIELDLGWWQCGTKWKIWICSLFFCVGVYDKKDDSQTWASSFSLTVQFSRAKWLWLVTSFITVPNSVATWHKIIHGTNKSLHNQLKSVRMLGLNAKIATIVAQDYPRMDWIVNESQIITKAALQGFCVLPVPLMLYTCYDFRVYF